MQENEFYIPANYLDSGYILNGRFAKRNAVEAVILAILGFIACKLCSVPFDIEHISIYIFACCPLALVGAAGIHGDPLSEYINNAYIWATHRQPYFYNSHGVAHRISPAQLVIDQPNLRDVLTDKLDLFKKSLSAPKVQYEEGVNFVFAADPELEALREAEERLAAEDAERDATLENSVIYGVQPLTDADSVLDVDVISDNLILEDYGDGE